MTQVDIYEIEDQSELAEFCQERCEQCGERLAVVEVVERDNSHYLCAECYNEAHQKQRL